MLITNFSQILVVLISALITYIFLKLLLPFLSKNFIDKPNSRSSHKENIPTSGGVGFAFIGSIGMMIFNNYTVLYCIPLALVGLWDDRVSLNRRFRYFVQIITSLLLFLSSPLGERIYEKLPLFTFIPFLLIYLIFASAFINFINFMDGLDGLVASCMSIIILVYALLVDQSYFALLGSIIGFLFLNWSPAKLFMGDIGSTFLGSVFVLCLLNSKSFNISFGLILIAMPLLLDAGVCVIRRFLDGQRIFDAHSLHLFQRLHKAGWSHSKVTLLYLSLTAFIACNYFFFGIYIAFIASILIFLFGCWLDKKYAIPF